MEIVFENPNRWDRWFDALPAADAARVEVALDRLEAFGSGLGRPHSAPLGKGLFELRIAGKPLYRIMYHFAEGDAIVLTFVKKTSPKAHEKAIAQARDKI